MGTIDLSLLGPSHCSRGSGINGERKEHRDNVHLLPPVIAPTIEERARGIRERSRVCRDNVYRLVIRSRRDNAAIFSVYYVQCTHVYATRVHVPPFITRSICTQGSRTRTDSVLFAISRILLVKNPNSKLSPKTLETFERERSQYVNFPRTINYHRTLLRRPVAIVWR